MAEEQAARSTGKEERSMGKVVRFSDKKGFGFIKPDDGGGDLFVHHTAIKSEGGYRSLSEDDAVEFTIVLSDSKYQAVNVTALGGGPIPASRRGDGCAKRSGVGGGSSWNRRNNGGGGGGATGAGCYNCGSLGHIARECTSNSSNNNNNGGCFKCGSVGHFARDCTRGNNNNNGNGGGGACYSCGGYGHLARDCPGGGGACYNCGGYGHFARDCNSSKGSNRIGAGGCFNCGMGGHYARECPNNS